MRSYFFVSVFLIAGGLVSAGLLEIYFRYMEGLEQVGLAQQGAATSAALQIERFVQDIATMMKAATKSADISSPEISAEYEFELKRLLFLAPAITEALAVDADGVIQAQVSRFRAVSPLLGKRVSQAAAFQESKQGTTHFGTVYFRDSDPYITVAVPIEHLAGEVIGVLQAETSLRDILDVVASVKLGRAGYSYVITRSGDVIAHPNISLVLQRRNLGQLNQVKAAFQPSPDAPRPKAIVAHNTEGQKVFSSHALIPILDWAVFIERPVGEAYEPIYASLSRTSILLLIGLGVALLASFFVARRVVRPLQTLRQGVERISSGDLSARLDIKTGDEIEILADEFNKMTAALQEAYAGLEQKVAERTKELALVNQKLDEANRHKSAFLASMSHELRTPLNAIIGFSEVLLDSSLKVTEEERSVFLTDILHSGKHLLKLINEILDLSKIEAGQMKLQIETVNLSDILGAVQSTMWQLAAKKSIDFRIESDARIGAFPMDAARIKQVLLNLLGNAVKFTPEGGKVWVRAGAENGMVRIEVGDSGPGIPEEECERIFLEFHQVRADKDTDKPEGTGLGLPLARKFVEMHGGKLWVESQVGKGSRFYFTLPLQQG